MTQVFDEMTILRDKEGYPDVEDSLDKLDAALTAYGVAHAFTLPRPATIEEDPDAVAVLCYNSEDHMTLSLVYALHLKTHRNVEDARLSNALVRVASRYLIAE